MAEVLLEKLTRREFRDRMDEGQLSLCIIPVAAIEQHLEHLAMEHDFRSVSTVAAAVAERLDPNVLVARGLMAGISEHHMTHPGTLSLRPGTFLAVLNDLVRSTVMAGFTNVLVLNGHGGNVAATTAVWDQFLREFQVNLQFMSYWDVLIQEDADELKSGNRMPQDLPGHAQEFETAMALSLFPENVRELALQDQVDQSPAKATAALGGVMFERIVERVAGMAQEMIDGERVAAVPLFHP